MGDQPADPLADARYTAEISNRMQVPDRIMVAGDSQKFASPSRINETPSGDGDGRYNDLGMRQRDPRLDMMVPDRIMVAGGNAHIESKGTPRELQLDAAIIPPTMDEVRVSTPPRSIKLGEHAFPSATDDETSVASSNSTPTYGRLVTNRAIHRSGAGSHFTDHSSEPKDAASLALMSEGGGGMMGAGAGAGAVSGGGGSGALGTPMHGLGGGRENLTPYEEIQLLRRQMAKLNHRLMAVELENQQQQQREMILTVLVAAYFIGKAVVWVNKSM